MKIFAVFCPVDKVHKSTEDSCLAGHNGGLNKLRVNKKKIKKRVYKPTRQQRPLESARAHEFLNFFYSIIFSETRVGRRRKKRLPSALCVVFRASACIVTCVTSIPTGIVYESRHRPLAWHPIYTHHNTPIIFTENCYVLEW